MLESQSAQRYHAGLPPVHHSTLADANAKRPCAVFVDLFAAVIAGVGRGLRRMVGESVHLIDSTSIRLSAMSDWSRFSATMCGVKAHSVYDADAEVYGISGCSSNGSSRTCISRFMGTSENAVRIQIATAMIAYILVRLAHAKQTLKQKLAHSATALLTAIRSHLFTRKTIADLLDPPKTQ